MSSILCNSLLVMFTSKAFQWWYKIRLFFSQWHAFTHIFWQNLVVAHNFVPIKTNFYPLERQICKIEVNKAKVWTPCSLIWHTLIVAQLIVLNLQVLSRKTKTDYIMEPQELKSHRQCETYYKVLIYACAVSKVSSSTAGFYLIFPSLQWFM